MLPSRLPCSPPCSNKCTPQALLTAINAARRAVLGGVLVRIAEDPVLTVRWAGAMRLSEAVAAYGGTVVDSLTGDHPTIAVGDLDHQPSGKIVLYPTWQGWSGGESSRAPPPGS